MIESKGRRWRKVLRELEKGGPDPSFSFLFKMGKAKMRKEQLRGWNDRYNQLLEYKAEHKNCLVPARYSKDKALGTWVVNQRTQYRLRSEGKHSFLTEERIKLLSEVGFVWSHQGNSWNDRHSQLLEYKCISGGNCRRF